jgi:phosphohistidine phosphatase
MKTLLLLRHGHSPSINGKSDFERKLSTTGINECNYINKFLINFNFNPELVLSSNSLRTTETSNLVVSNLIVKPKMVFTNILYNANVEAIIESIKEVDETIHTLMVVGHNPSITNLAEILNPTNKEAFPNLSNYQPTCKLVVLNIEASSWSDIKSKESKVINIITP